MPSSSHTPIDIAAYQPRSFDVGADPTAHWTRDSYLDTYWQAHPRFLFLKTLPPHTRVLDLGAGSGGLVFWKEYLPPPRRDLHLTALGLSKGEFFERCDRSLVLDFEKDQLPFEPGEFGAIVASHVFEHFSNPHMALRKAAGLLANGGRIYIEVPSIFSKLPPPAKRFQDLGWPLQISNFFDDPSHVDTWSLSELRRMGEKEGLEVFAAGYIDHRFLEDALMRAGLNIPDQDLLLFGFWSKTRWAQYVVFETRPLSRRGAFERVRDRITDALSSSTRERNRR